MQILANAKMMRKNSFYYYSIHIRHNSYPRGRSAQENRPLKRLYELCWGCNDHAIVQKRGKSGRYRFVKGGVGCVRAVSMSFFIGLGRPVIA